MRAVLGSLLLLAAAPARADGWRSVEGRDCEIWRPGQEIEGTFGWSGDCVDGKAHGPGLLTWRLRTGDDWEVGRVEAEMEQGRLRSTWLQTDGGCGVWLDGLYSGETITWSGDCVDRRAEGEGTLARRYSLDGKPHSVSFEGTYRGGRAEGPGVLTAPEGYRAEGAWQGGKWHGRFTVRLEDGSRFEGEYQDGRQTGQGIMVWANGGRYEGAFLDGAYHGRGSFVWPSGERYEGEWRGGLQHGVGTMAWSDGERYEGEWWDGERTGRGVYLSADGERFEGTFVKGDLNGRGTCTNASGDRYEGELKDGRRHGIGIYTWANGNRYEGEYREGRRHGQGTLTFELPASSYGVTSEVTRFDGRFADGLPVDGTCMPQLGASFRCKYNPQTDGWDRY